MKTYTHKPTQVQAVRFEPDGAHRHELPRGVVCTTMFAFGAQPDYSVAHLVFQISNDKGWIKVYAGDWVIYGPRGEIYPVAPEIFEQQYHEAT